MPVLQLRKKSEGTIVAEPMHAVAITAYTDFAQLERLVARLDPHFFRIFIHIDARSKVIGEDELDKLRTMGAEVSKIYKIRWGSITHLWALMHLIKLAVRDEQVKYVHLISGQDYPIADVDTFISKCDGRLFMEYIPISSHSYHDYFVYNLFYFMNYQWRVLAPLFRVLTPASFKLQRRLKIRRRNFGSFRRDQLYKGLVWISVPRIAAQRMLNDRNAANFLRALRLSHIPEEIFFQSYFLNSDLRSLVVNDKLRFQDWRCKNESIPAILDDHDVKRVLGSGALFARKVTTRYSSSFADQIDSIVFGGSSAKRCRP